jgi:hypothetical protein
MLRELARDRRGKLERGKKRYKKTEQRRKKEGKRERGRKKKEIGKALRTGYGKQMKENENEKRRM